MRLRLLFFSLLLTAQAVPGQLDNYALKREIIGETNGWSRIVLPDSLYSKTRPDLADIRVGGVRENGELVEAPFILRQSPEAVEKTVEFRLINQSRGAGGYFFTFEVPSQELVNTIDLNFGVQNFDWKVRLEGSNDQKEWFTVVDGYRIVSISNNFISYGFTSLRFADAKYRYLRLFIPSADDPKFGRASLTARTTNPGTYRTYAVKAFKVMEDKLYKQSVIDIELSEKVPVSFLKISVKDEFDYYRAVSVKYQGADANGRPVYVNAASDVLSSFDREGIRFPEVKTDQLQIAVQNNDSPPLNFESFEVKGRPYEVIARFSEPARYYLLYSKTGATAPQYDIATFADKIPDSPPELKLGEEEVNGEALRSGKPVFESKLWVWAAMALAILVLGFFSLKLLRR